MLLYAHALLEILTKSYHMRERTTCNTNIKTKLSLLGYKTMPLVCYFMRMRCWKFSQRGYHKGEHTSSTANIKVKYSLLGYKTMPLADVTLCACVVGNHPKRVPQA